MHPLDCCSRHCPHPHHDTHRAHLECGRLHDCPAIVESPTRRYDANDPRNPSCVADAIADLTVQAARIADAIEALGKQASYGR